jgi:hypothetical protein
VRRSPQRFESSGRAPARPGRRALSIATEWGIRPEERSGPWGCDAFAAPGARVLYRGTSVRAPAAVVFRWLCQLRVAPYSYDWIDNRGRRSPRTLTPGLDQLAVGQPFLIFELAAFEPGCELTLVTPRGGRGERAFGRVALSYRAAPDGRAASRLLAKLCFLPPPGARGRLLGALLPWGDLVMMRKQLLTLARLAERSAAP